MNWKFRYDALEGVREMNISAAWTIGGSFVLGDSDDEDAPLVTVNFHNEATEWAMDREARRRLLTDLFEEMIKIDHPYENRA